MKKQPTPDLVHDALRGARLSEALTLLIREYVSQHRVSPVMVLGALTFVLGRAVGLACVAKNADFEGTLDLLVRSIRRAALDEIARRPTLH